MNFLKFKTFLNSLKNETNSILIESVVSGFHVCFESEAQVTWFAPAWEDEVEEFERYADKVDLNTLHNMFNQGKLVPLTEDVWASLENSDSYKISKIEEAIEYANSYGKDWESIVEAFKTGSALPASIIIKWKTGESELVAGNTRLMVARAFKVQPIVFLITF